MSPSHAGTAFDGRHLFQIAEDRILKIDPKTGRVLATIPAPGGGGARARLGRRDALGGAVSGSEDPSDRSGNRGDSSHHRVQPLRHRGHLGRRRPLARHLGRRRKRVAASRSSNGRGPRAARHAAGSKRVGARIRWRRPVVLRRRKQREGESRPPAEVSSHSEAPAFGSVGLDYRAPTVCREDHRGGDVIAAGCASRVNGFSRLQDLLLGVVVLEIALSQTAKFFPPPKSLPRVDGRRSGRDRSCRESRTS